MKLFLAVFFVASLSYAGTSKIQDPCQLAKIKHQELDLISSNIANVNTTSTEEGGPYQRKVLKCKKGECAVVSENKIIKKYMPEHPDADLDGYVSFPKIDVRTEMNSMLAALADYEKAKEKCE